MIRVMIADDHQMIREGIRKILSTCQDIGVVCEAADGFNTLEVLSDRQCDCTLLILDWSMPGGGESLIRRIKALRPELAILILSMHNEAAIARAALQSGANGYVTKDSDSETLIYAVKHVGNGQQFIDPTLTANVLSDTQYLKIHSLSEREQEVFQLLMQGYSVSDIANLLHISIKTVSSHKCNLMQKLDVNNIIELVRYAIQKNYI